MKIFVIVRPKFRLWNPLSWFVSKLAMVRESGSEFYFTAGQRCSVEHIKVEFEVEFETSQWGFERSGNVSLDFKRLFHLAKGDTIKFHYDLDLGGNWVLK